MRLIRCCHWGCNLNSDASGLLSSLRKKEQRKEQECLPSHSKGRSDRRYSSKLSCQGLIYFSIYTNTFKVPSREPAVTHWTVCGMLACFGTLWMWVAVVLRAQYTYAVQAMMWALFIHGHHTLGIGMSSFIQHREFQLIIHSLLQQCMHSCVVVATQVAAESTAAGKLWTSVLLICC